MRQVIALECPTVAITQDKRALDLPHQSEFSSMGKRMQVAEAAKTNKDEAGGFGERLASLRKAAGFTQV